MSESIERDDLIFLAAAIVISQKPLAQNMSNPGEVAHAVAVARELYDAVHPKGQDSQVMGVNEYLKGEAKKAGG